DIPSGGGGSVPVDLTAIGSTLFFRAQNLSQLWESNGTDAGTVPVQPSQTFVRPDNLTNVNGTLFFKASFDELWRSDGTAKGPVQFHIFGVGFQGVSQPSLANLNGALVFAADDGTIGRELWRSNGTAPGTTLLKDINPGNIGSNPYSLIDANGTLFFLAKF